MSPSADSDTTSEQGQSPQVEKREQRDRRAWTEEEDAALIDAVRRLGSARGPGSAWTQISQAVGPTRTNKDCRKRWFHSLDPSLRKGKWSADEDEALKRLYRQLGPQWKEIALHIPGRKDDQCSKRWRDVLDPILTPKKPWTPLEDALLLQLHEQHGAKWTTIADHLPGRSPLACRNRSRKYFKLSAGEPSDPNPSPQGGASSGISNPPVDSPQDDRRPSIANSSATVSTSAHTLSGDHAGPSSSTGPRTEGTRAGGAGDEGDARREGFQGWELVAMAGGAHPFDLNSMLFNYPLGGSGASAGGGANGGGADAGATGGRDISQDRVRRSGGDEPSAGESSGPRGMAAPSEALESSWPSVLEGSALSSMVDSQPGGAGHGQADSGGDVAMDGGSGAGSNDPGTDFITHWLSSFPNSYLPTSSGPSPETTHSGEKLPHPATTATPGLGAQPGSGVPITNVWGLLLALDSGQNAVHVDAQFLRQLLADASGGKSLTGMA
ncbi:hypothetical protein IAT38_006248 [Cryptococcus sp. DSM 104549]